MIQKLQLIVIVSYLFLLFTAPNNAAEKETYSQEIEGISSNFQKIYGQVDFRQRPLLEALVHVHPRSDNEINSFEGYRLLEISNKQHLDWMNKYFKGELLKAITAVSPSGYYLHDGSTRYETNFLSFKTKYKQNDVTMIENGQAVILTIKPDGFDPKSGIDKSFLTDVFMNDINLGISKEADIHSKFTLTDKMKEGYKFAMPDAIKYHSHHHKWKDNVLGFVGNNGVTIILMKLRDSMSSKFISFDTDRNWLKDSIIKKGQ